MTLLLDRAIQGPKTHAFIIGVGSYPHAKAGLGAKPILRKVPDLPSAADSAKLMCDWLLAHQDQLAAPLATLEVLISDPAGLNNRYQWARGPVEAATDDNIEQKGQSWFDRLTVEEDTVAFFYCCGHGASHLQQPVLFTEDLNRKRSNAWSHINLFSLAQSLRKANSVSAAFLFSDACGQFVPDFELSTAQETLFFDEPNVFGVSRNQVSLLCAAGEGLKAYEGPEQIGSAINFGRFTQVLLKGLSGSSARWSKTAWGVAGRDLLADLKSLRHVYFGHWGDNEPFEPYQVVIQTDPHPIVYPADFELPFVVITDPADKMALYDFVISQQDVPQPPWLKNRMAGDANAWSTTLPPSRSAHYAIAVRGAEYYLMLFQPKEPLFDQLVPVS